MLGDENQSIGIVVRGWSAGPRLLVYTVLTVMLTSSMFGRLALCQQSYEVVGEIAFAYSLGATAEKVGSVSIVSPDVLRLKYGAYRMYFAAKDESDNVNIQSAYSEDGLKWPGSYVGRLALAEPGIRIDHGSASEMDSQVGDPDAVLGTDGKYYMAYTGRQPTGSKTGSQYYSRILFAVSEDGVDWVKQKVSFSNPTRQDGFARSPDITIINGTYVMHYTSGAGIFKATSNDAVNWVSRGALYNDWGHDSATVYVDGTYYMFVAGPSNFKSTVSANDDLYMSISPDGVNWPRKLYHLVVKESDGSNSKNIFQNPTAVVLEDGSLRIYANFGDGTGIVVLRPLSSLPKAI